MSERDKNRKRIITDAVYQTGYYGKGGSDCDLNSFILGMAKGGCWTKYGRDLDNLGYYNGRKNGYDWCCVFVDWLFVMTYGFKAAQEMQYQPAKSTAAGVKYAWQFYEKAGKTTKLPKPGYRVFFGENGKYQHTGLVVDVSSKYITVIEGNFCTKLGNRKVAKCRYNRNDSKIIGYGIPAYDEE